MMTSLVFSLIDVAEPWVGCEAAWDQNRQNNFFLPRASDLQGKFANKDAK
jgi:hypothetical protein